MSTQHTTSDELRLNIAKQIVKARVPGYKMTNGDLNDEARLVPGVYIDNIIALFHPSVTEMTDDLMAALTQLVMDSRKDDVGSDIPRIEKVMALIKKHELDARINEIAHVEQKAYTHIGGDWGTQLVSERLEELKKRRQENIGE